MTPPPPIPLRLALPGALAIACLAGCGSARPTSPPPAASSPKADPVPVSTADPPSPPASTPRPRAPAPPLPEPLRAMISEHGLRLDPPEDYRFEPLDRFQTRFDLAAFAPADDRELRFSFWLKGAETREAEALLSGIAETAVMNFAREGTVCPAVAASPALTRQLGADRVLRVCFQPAEYLSTTLHAGVTYALYKRDVSLSLVVVLLRKPLDRGQDLPAEALAVHFAGKAPS